MESAVLKGEMKPLIKIIILAVIAAVIFSVGPVPLTEAAWEMGQNHFTNTSNYYLTPSMRRVIEKILYRRFYSSEEQLAQALYRWVVENIEYGSGFGSATASHVFNNRRGKCAGLSRLYISLARDVGIDARYVRVKVDCYGEPVKHACVLVEIDGKEKLIDPAYEIFGVQHREWRVACNQSRHSLLALASPSID